MSDNTLYVIGMPISVPTRVQELIGGMEGVDLEKYGQYTKLVKGDLEIFILPPRTCVVLKKRPDQDKSMLFPNFSIASHHVGSHHDNDLMGVVHSSSTTVK